MKFTILTVIRVKKSKVSHPLPWSGQRLVLGTGFKGVLLIGVFPFPNSTVPGNLLRLGYFNNFNIEDRFDCFSLFNNERLSHEN